MAGCPIFQVFTFCVCIISCVYTFSCPPEKYIKVRYEYEFSDPFSLECGRPDLDPDVTYEWFKMNPKAAVTNDGIISVEGSELRFNYCSITSQGVYMCNIKNPWNGKVLQRQIFVLRRINIRRPENDPDSVTYSFKQLSYQSIPCPLISEVAGEDIKYEWYTNKLSENNGEISADSFELYVDLQGTLHMTPVFISDTILDDGVSFRKFFCLARSTKPHFLTLGHDVYFNVTEGNIRYIPPRFRYKSEDEITAEQNKTVHMDCVVFGYDGIYKNRIEWIKPDKTRITKNTEKYELSFRNRTLTIKNVQFEDAGYYICDVYNRFSKDGPTRSQSFLAVTCP